MAFAKRANKEGSQRKGASCSRLGRNLRTGQWQLSALPLTVRHAHQEQIMRNLCMRFEFLGKLCNPAVCLLVSGSQKEKKKRK